MGDCFVGWVASCTRTLSGFKEPCPEARASEYYSKLSLAPRAGSSNGRAGSDKTDERNREGQKTSGTEQNSKIAKGLQQGSTRAVPGKLLDLRDQDIGACIADGKLKGTGCCKARVTDIRH